jgi:hypothetical protein
MTFADSSSFSEFAWRKEANDVFSDHEKLKFAVGWSFITVGSATMEVSDIEEYGGRKCYHIVSKARSAKFFDTFFKVRDVNESWIDAESLCSLKFVNNISEGKYKKVETLLFDHENQKYLIVESSKTGEIPLWVQDVLSSLYYLRTKELYVGAEFNIDAHSGDKSWPLKVKVLRKDKVKVPAGKFECFVVEPHVREDSGIFQAKGKIWVWLTADEKKIPVLMKSKVFIGSIVAKLVEFKI